MYISEFDESRALGVCIFQGATAPSEWEAHLRDMNVLMGWHGRGKPQVALIAVLLDGAGVPDAVIRQKLAALTSKPAYEPLLVLVTRHPLVLGALTAVKWLQTGRKTRHELEVAPDVVAALRHLERRRGEPLPELAAMVSRCQAQLDRPSRVAL
jgi:hypothetical protein